MVKKKITLEERTRAGMAYIELKALELFANDLLRYTQLSSKNPLIMARYHSMLEEPRPIENSDGLGRLIESETSEYQERLNRGDLTKDEYSLINSGGLFKKYLQIVTDFS